MKIALTGKGGVGKTTITACLSRYFADKGYEVLAVDADPDANLGLALGMSEEMIDSITPISEMKDLAEERTNATTGGYGAFFKMNPEVADIPEKFCRRFNGVKLLTMGTVDLGGSGCVCPEHVLLKMLTTHLVLYEKDMVIMDMEAGIEHLGRGTASAVDAFITVVEPGVRSIQTYKRVCKLAADIGIHQVYVIGNKIRGQKDRDFLTQRIGAENIVGFIDYQDSISESDRNEHSPYDVPAIREMTAKLGDAIETIVQEKKK
ncbi:MULTISPECIES: AAA family ATPase [Eubacterium]|uniref:CO dehydrogenase maturation factor n=2 Tax=Eubacterium TaxID=1730 RepID=A0A1H3XI91_9FIRM|nr:MULTISPECIES: AAA family ATPase [Eubacterium]MDD4690714.1 AAA family ATPase [Eubacterium aggregans]MEA5072615.1 AAA family ATPase [Eubacterium aggregans]SDX77699.1 CO dehydrogenase maturation factor [Eubacterium barkeri]SDZ99127.1 CO dehydrogenase maturation factor [Eubacterium aggregans]